MIRKQNHSRSVSDLLCYVKPNSLVTGMLILICLCLCIFAHDTQVYGRCSPSDMGDHAARVKHTASQYRQDGTHLYSTSRRLPQLQTTLIRIVSEIISSSSSVSDLVDYFDADLLMRTHVQRMVGAVCCSPSDS